jgi:cell wall-associated NlpC family hydrolase
MATKLGDACFSASTFAACAGISMPRGGMHRQAAAINEICQPLAGSIARLSSAGWPELKSAERVTQVEKPNEWPKTQVLGALRHGRQKQIGRLCKTVRGAVMLSHVVGIESCAIAGFGDAEPL